MSPTFKETIIKTFRQETWKERSTRMLPGMAFSAFTTTVFVLVSAVINNLFFPDLNLGVDIRGIIINLLEYGLVLALAGTIVGWFTEEYMAIFGGGIVLSLLLFLSNLVLAWLGGGGIVSLQSFFTALPMMGACILLAWAIRAAINRYVSISRQEDRKKRRTQTLQLVLIILLVGLIPGVFSRFGVSSEYAIRTLSESLDPATTYPPLESRFPLNDVPGLQGHLGQDYKFFTRTSPEMAGALDVTIRYSDGYTITCIVPIDSGSASFLDTCNEGRSISKP